MKRTELENGIAKQLSSVILREDEMLENIMQMVDAHVNKQLLLHNVSQQRKLLIAFLEMNNWLSLEDEENAKGVVDCYLKAINCG